MNSINACKRKTVRPKPGCDPQGSGHRANALRHDALKFGDGAETLGSSSLQQAANILQVPVTFFFEGAPGQTKPDGKAPSPNYVSDFLATADGLALTKAFMKIKNAKIRRTIVDLVDVVAGNSSKK